MGYLYVYLCLYRIVMCRYFIDKYIFLPLYAYDGAKKPNI